MVLMLCLIKGMPSYGGTAVVSVPSGRGDYACGAHLFISALGMWRLCRSAWRKHSYLQDGETMPVHAQIS